MGIGSIIQPEGAKMLRASGGACVGLYLLGAYRHGQCAGHLQQPRVQAVASFIPSVR